MGERYNFIDRGRYTELQKQQDIIENLEEDNSSDDEEDQEDGEDNTKPSSNKSSFNSLLRCIGYLSLVGGGIFFYLLTRSKSDRGADMVNSLFQKLKMDKQKIALGKMYEYIITKYDEAKANELIEKFKKPDEEEKEED